MIAEITRGNMHACTGPPFSTTNAEGFQMLYLRLVTDLAVIIVLESTNGKTFFLLFVVEQ